MTDAQAGCGCGCGTLTHITNAQDACSCGCECCAPGQQKSPAEEATELRRLREQIDQRLTELDKA